MPLLFLDKDIGNFTPTPSEPTLFEAFGKKPSFFSLLPACMMTFVHHVVRTSLVPYWARNPQHGKYLKTRETLQILSISVATPADPGSDSLLQILGVEKLLEKGPVKSFKAA